MKKKWGILAAVVVVIGGLLVFKFGVMDQTIEKKLTSQDVWKVTLKSPFNGSDAGDAYVKFDKKDVFAGDSIKQVQEAQQDKSDVKGTAEYVDKNTVKIKFGGAEFKEYAEDGFVTLKVADLKKQPMEASIGIKLNDDELSFPATLVPADKDND